MKKCTKCGADMQDEAMFCTRCGEKIGQPEGPTKNENQNYGTGNQNYGTGNQNYTAEGQNYTYANAGMDQGPSQQYYAPPQDIYDHTTEFDPKDIADNKVIAMIAYLLGIMGIIIALLGANKSEYASFHVRQALRFKVLEVLLGIIALVLCWTFVIPIAAGVMYIVLYVVRIICFFSICNGKAKEAPVIRSFKFLN